MLYFLDNRIIKTEIETVDNITDNRPMYGLLDISQIFAEWKTEGIADRNSLWDTNVSRLRFLNQIHNFESEILI